MAQSKPVNPQDRTRFIRLSLVIFEELTPLMQDILQNKISPNDILNQVSRHKSLFQKLRAEQQTLIQNAQNDGYKDFDITLTYTLLRNLKCVKVTAPTQGWGTSQMPGNGETTLGDDIERIRLIRNKICGHSAVPSLPETEFQDHWSNISDICARMQTLLGKNYVQSLKKAEVCAIDTEMENTYLDKLRDLCNAEKSTREQLQEIREAIQDIAPRVKETVKIEAKNPRKKTLAETLTDTSISILNCMVNTINEETSDSQIELLYESVEKFIKENKEDLSKFASNQFFKKLQKKIKQYATWKKNAMEILTNFFTFTMKLKRYYGADANISHGSLLLTLTFSSERHYDLYMQDFERGEIGRLILDVLLYPPYLASFRLRDEDLIIYLNDHELTEISDLCNTRGSGEQSNIGPRQMKQSTMEVNVSNRMTRFRYDTELNRNIGKEELVSIKFININTDTFVRIHCIDPANKKAHPYCLIGDKCESGVYHERITPSAENKYTLSCKAAIKIPRRGDNEAELIKRKQIMEKHLGIYSEEMKKTGYWNMNKNVNECKCVALLVEAFYKTGQQLFMLQQETEGLLNAKYNKDFGVYTIRPFSYYCTGSKSQSENMLIVLTANSFIPKGIEIIFQDDEGWCVKTEKPTVIKNVLEVKIPPYKNTEIEEPKVVKIIVKSDTKFKLAAKPIEFTYKPKIGESEPWMWMSRNLACDSVHDATSEKSKMKLHLEKRRKMMSKPSATITVPHPSDGDRVQDVINTEPVFDPLGGIIDPNFGFALTSTAAPSYPAVLLPSNAPVTSPTQPGFMESSSNQGIMLYENASTSAMYQVPVPPPHLSSTASQIHMPTQSPQNPFSLPPPQNVALPSVTLPQPPQFPLSNEGKFKTVAIAGTNQWLLIDQFGKPLLVLGGQNDEVSTVQELPSLDTTDSNSPSQFDMPFTSLNQISAMSMNTNSSITDNDLEEDDAGLYGIGDFEL